MGEENRFLEKGAAIKLTSKTLHNHTIVDHVNKTQTWVSHMVDSIGSIQLIVCFISSICLRSIHIWIYTRIKLVQDVGVVRA